MATAPKILLYNKVILYDGSEGIVKYMGEVAGKEGVIYGIELSKGEGSNNGTYNGTKYFSTKDDTANTGRFCTANKIAESSKTAESRYPFQIGDKVMCVLPDVNCGAILRYIGIPAWSAQRKVYCGLQLCRDNGKGQGEKKGTMYFSAPKDFALYVQCISQQIKTMETIKNELNISAVDFDSPFDRQKLERAFDVLHFEMNPWSLSAGVDWWGVVNVSCGVPRRLESGKNRLEWMDEIPQSQLEELQRKKERIFQTTMHELLMPHFSNSELIATVLEYHGPLVFDIRYSLDIFPFLHEKVKTPPRKQLWQQSEWDEQARRRCAFFRVDNFRGNVLENVCTDFCAHIRQKFCLRPTINIRSYYRTLEEQIETVVFKVVSTSNNHLYSAHVRADDKAYEYIGRNIQQFVSNFTKLYLDQLCQFAVARHSDDMLFKLELLGIDYLYRNTDSGEMGSRSRCWTGDSQILMADGNRKRIKDVQIGEELTVLRLKDKQEDTARVMVKIESIVDREYEMCCVDGKMWITPYHAYLTKESEWMLPWMTHAIVKRYEYSIFNLIVSEHHVINVDGVWTHTLGHDFKGPIIEHPVWGSSCVMNEMWSKYPGYPNVVERI